VNRRRVGSRHYEYRLWVTPHQKLDYSCIETRPTNQMKWRTIRRVNHWAKTHANIFSLFYHQCYNVQKIWFTFFTVSYTIDRIMKYRPVTFRDLEGSTTLNMRNNNCFYNIKWRKVQVFFIFWQIRWRAVTLCLLQYQIVSVGCEIARFFTLIHCSSNI